MLASIHGLTNGDAAGKNPSRFNNLCAATIHLGERFANPEPGKILMR